MYTKLKAFQYLAVIDDNLEESIHQQNLIRLNGRAVEQHWFRWSMKAVAV